MASITPHYRSVSQLLQSRSFAIDEYQREYKWETKNLNELLSDLLGKFQTFDEPNHTPSDVQNYGEYFLGSIIVAKRGEKSFLVDGQQRVTSLTLLLIYLYREACRLNLSVESTLIPLIYSDNFGERKFNLDIEERRPVIQALFTGEDFNPSGRAESVQTIHARYRDIEQFDLAGELGDSLEKFAYWLTKKVGVIEIEADTDEHAYAIFETMNDRGKPLSPVDMAKAFLLSPITDDAQRTAANNTWKQTVNELTRLGSEPDPERDATVIKAWLRAQYAETTRDRKAGAVDRDWELVGTIFHRWLRDNADKLGLKDAGRNYNFMTSEFPFFASVYKLIQDASDRMIPGLESVYYNASNDFTWQPTVLLAPLTITDSPAVVRQKIELTASYLDIWIMRRVVNYIRVGYSSVAYAMWALVKEIRQLPVEQLREVLLRRLADDDVTLSAAESRDRGGIRDLRLNQFSRKYIGHILARMTSFVEAESGLANRFPEYMNRDTKNAFDVEHIAPNTPSRYAEYFADPSTFAHWRDNIAGLLLLPADVNRSLQDKPFEEKAAHYAKQNLFAASLTDVAYVHQPQFRNFIERTGLPFQAFEQFGPAEQELRRELVYKLAELVWSPQRLSLDGTLSAPDHM